MTTYRRLLPALVLVLASSFPVFALPFSAYVQGTSITEASTGIEQAITNNVLRLAPQHPAATRIQSAFRIANPDVAVECLFFMPYPKSTDHSTALLASYNSLRAIRSMESIEYYSASRKKIRNLYSYSSLIKSPNDTSEIPDTDVQSLGSSKSETLFARQKDNSFGDNLYKISLSYENDYILHKTTNLSPLSVGFIPAVKEHEVNVYILVIAADEGLIFYASSYAQNLLISGLKARVQESFSNRAKGAWQWFKEAASSRISF